MRRQTHRYPLAIGAAVFFGLAVALPLLLAQPAAARRYAVLVGVQDYDHSRLNTLDYVVNDVVELAELLRRHGYEVTLLRSRAEDARLVPTLGNIQARLAEVLEKCRRQDTVLVALAGHGLQFEKERPTDAEDAFFCPQDARPLPNRRETLLSLAALYKQLDDSGAGVKLLLVDACRDDPTVPRGTRRGVDGSTAPRPPRGVAALFSCSAGESAYESPRLKHGVFFHYVLEGLRGKAAAEGEVTWDSLQMYVRRRVSRDIGELIGGGVRQTPALNAGELAGEPPVLLAMRDGSRDADTDAVERSHPDPLDCTSAGSVGAAQVQQAQQAWAQHLGRKVLESVDLGEGVTMDLVLIPPGAFIMGSPASQESMGRDEGPVHTVELTRPFWMGKYEVTRGQFRLFALAEHYRTDAEKDRKGEWGCIEDDEALHHGPEFTWQNTGFPQTDQHPVVNVSYNDAIAFCRWLGEKARAKVRLPTEAEWEYSCRAGTRTRFCSGNEDDSLEGAANIADRSAKERWGPATLVSWDDGFAYTAPVGGDRRPNAFGLYDMHGNAWEWCSDRFGPYAAGRQRDPEGPTQAPFRDGPFRVLRGGSFNNAPRECRCANRGCATPVYRRSTIGFRVVLVR